MQYYSARDQYSGQIARNVANTNAQITALQNDNKNLHMQMQKLHAMVYQMKTKIEHDHNEQRVINVRKREYDCCVEVSKVCGKTFENIYERRIPGCGVYEL